MNARPNFIPGLAHVAKNLGTDATVLSFCPNSAAADNEAHRLGVLDSRDEHREWATAKTVEQIRDHVAGLLDAGDLGSAISDWTTGFRGAPKVEIETTPLDALYDLAKEDGGVPEVRVHLAALIASPAGAALRQALSHGWAERVGADVAEARGWAA